MGNVQKDLLDSLKVEQLNFWLSSFVVEVCHKDRKPYPPATINNILAVIGTQNVRHLAIKLYLILQMQSIQVDGGDLC